MLHPTKESRPIMKTLVQTRNGPLQKKLNKKRKLELCSLIMTPGSRLLKQAAPSHRDRKGDTNVRKLLHKKESKKRSRNESSKKQDHGGSNDNKRSLNDSSKKQNQGGSNDPHSLSLSTKDKTRDIGQLQTQNPKRRRRHKRKKAKVALDEASQLQRRARYLMVKLKLEQNLIDAYSGEGWKGQSREKIKPDKELFRAEKQILKCKLGIRDAIHQLDLLGSVGQIDESLIAPDGSVHHEHQRISLEQALEQAIMELSRMVIFCKKCKSQEASEDNDIILCDGTCNCAFHQKCIDPPLATEDIPPEDEGCLCKYCDCKMEILEAMNAHLGTQFSVDSTWQDIFKEEALLSDVGNKPLDCEEEWPDDESDDNDYDPDGDENNSCSFSMEDSGLHEESSCSSLSCPSESEVYSESGLPAERNGIPSDIPLLHPNCVSDFSDHEIVRGPRQRAAVDYRKLYDEMFGKDSTTGELCSEDEDWGPPRKRRREKECDAATTLMTLCESEVKNSDLQNLEVEKNHLPNSKARKRPLRIPSDAVEKLRQTFAENELPSQAVKQRISELLGLDYEKVNKWFKNARYIALKNRKHKERSTHYSPSKMPDSEADKTAEDNVSKCSSLPTSTTKMKKLKRVSWNANLTTLLSPLKRRRLKKTSFGNTKAIVELSDDMSLKKHLLQLKAKRRHKKRVRSDTKDLQEQSAERQMEQLCRLEAKVRKLKQILSMSQEPETNKSNDTCLSENVFYIPVAALKERLCS